MRPVTTLQLHFVLLYEECHRSANQHEIKKKEAEKFVYRGLEGVFSIETYREHETEARFLVANNLKYTSSTRLSNPLNELHMNISRDAYAVFERYIRRATTHHFYVNRGPILGNKLRTAIAHVRYHSA